eukprot:854901_1
MGLSDIMRHVRHGIQRLFTTHEDDEQKVNIEGRTVLHRAAYEGSVDVVQRLLQNPRIDVNQPDHIGRTPLIIAARNGHFEVVRCLLGSPAIEVNKRGRTLPFFLMPDKADHTDRSALNWALSKCYSDIYVDIARFLLDQPAIDVNKADNKGETPLYIAASNGSIDIVRLLLASPTIDVNAPNHLGNSPLHIAAYFINRSLPLLLEIPKLNLHAVNEDGQTARMCMLENVHLSDPNSIRRSELMVSMLDSETIKRQEAAALILLGVWQCRLPVDIIGKITKYV